MARIDSKVIFVTTSPRTPAKMIPEIELLNTHFSGQKWNTETQRAFMELLIFLPSYLLIWGFGGSIALRFALSES